MDQFLTACDICEQNFNSTSRIPKITQCGHSVCSQCEKVKQCCQRYKQMHNKERELPINQFILENIQTSHPKLQRRPSQNIQKITNLQVNLKEAWKQLDLERNAIIINLIKRLEILESLIQDYINREQFQVQKIEQNLTFLEGQISQRSNTIIKFKTYNTDQSQLNDKFSSKMSEQNFQIQILQQTLSHIQKNNEFAIQQRKQQTQNNLDQIKILQGKVQSKKIKIQNLKSAQQKYILQQQTDQQELQSQLSLVNNLKMQNKKNDQEILNLTKELQNSKQNESVKIKQLQEELNSEQLKNQQIQQQNELEKLNLKKQLKQLELQAQEQNNQKILITNEKIDLQSQLNEVNQSLDKEKTQLKNTKQLLDTVKTEKEKQQQSIQLIQTEIQNLKEQNQKLLNENFNLKKQQMQKQIEEENQSDLNEEIKALEEKNKKLQGEFQKEKQDKIKLTQEIENLQQEILNQKEETDLIQSSVEKQLLLNGKLSKQLSEEKQQNDQLNQQIQILKSSNNESKKSKQRVQDLEEELAQLKFQLSEVNSKNKHFSELNQQLAQLKAILKGKDGFIDDLENQLQATKEYIISIEKIRQQCTCQKIRRQSQDLQIQTIKSDTPQSSTSNTPKNLSLTPRELNEFKKGEENQLQIQKLSRDLAEQKKSEDFMNLNQYEEIEDFEVEKQKYLDDNLLLVSIQGMQGEKPMINAAIFKLFEQLMDAKYKQDVEDLQAKIRPRQMTNFLFDYLMQQQGLRALANKTLAQLLLGLNQLYKDGHQYGILFCRFIQVFHPDPIDLVLATFLTRIRIEFNKHAEQYAKKKISEMQKNPAKAKEALAQAKTTFGKIKYDLEACGGEAPLSDAFNLIGEHFEQDNFYGDQLKNLLLPQSQKKEYQLFLLLNKIGKIQQDSQQLFSLMDKDQKDSLSYFQLKEGLSQLLGLQLNEEEADKLMELFEVDEQGSISSLEFQEKFKIWEEKQNAKDI